MFERELENVMKYIKRIGARYQMIDTNGYVMIYVYEKDAYDKKNLHPGKYGDLYVSCLRISDHGGDGLYTRRDGITREMTDNEIKDIIDELTGI